MKILHVITSLRTGGAEKLMVGLLPRLKAKGFDADLCVFNGQRTAFYEELLQKGICITDFGEGNGVYNIKNIPRLRKLMKHYDIIHTHNTAPQLFAALANVGLGRKLVTTEHNTSNRRRAWKGYTAVDRWMYNRYNHVICISQKAEDNLRHYIGGCKAGILTINNGIDIAGYAAAEASDELEGLAPGSRRIIMVAGFRAQKDQDTLIRALKLLPGTFHLFLVGDGARRKEIETLTTELNLRNRVHLMGIRSDVPALLHAADYVVMSSHYEGLSLSSVEGMCVGRPFLASDVDGLREVVSGAGILFPHGGSAALAAEILKLENSPEQYKAVADVCGRRAADYDISKMVEGYERIYKQLLK